MQLPYLHFPYLQFPYLQFLYLQFSYLQFLHLHFPYLLFPYLQFPYLQFPYSLHFPYLQSCTFLTCYFLTCNFLTCNFLTCNFLTCTFLTCYFLTCNFLTCNFLTCNFLTCTFLTCYFLTCNFLTCNFRAKLLLSSLPVSPSRVLRAPGTSSYHMVLKHLRATWSRPEQSHLFPEACSPNGTDNRQQCQRRTKRPPPEPSDILKRFHALYDDKLRFYMKKVSELYCCYKPLRDMGHICPIAFSSNFPKNSSVRGLMIEMRRGE